MKTKKFITRLFLCLIIFSPFHLHADSYQETLIREAEQKDLAHHPYWKRLLHYHSGLLWGEKSDIDGGGFFLSPRGRIDPKAELEATLKSFFEPVSASTEVEHPQCRYPARFAWLNEQLLFLPELPVVRCERFDSWREKLDASGVTMIFASYYMNNPSSMYGHTFLRLKRKGKSDDDRLLDYTVNFAANTNTTNGLAFAVLGLLGGYPGTYSTLPYYMKIQKYNNMESRDLWEYQLNFTQEQVDRLVQHVWELGHTSISYYFLNKNCSYQLLPLLEVARSDLDLSSIFSARAIPLDTLRVVLNEKGLLKERTLRASHLEKMRAIRSQLTSEQQKSIRQIVEFEKSLPEDLDPLMLEGTQQYLRYRYGFKRPQPDRVAELEQQISLFRSQRPTQNFESVISSYTLRLKPPEAAHGAAKINLGYGATRDDQTFEEFSIRPALHDLNSDATGFIPASTLEMFEARFRFNNDLGKFYLEQGTLIHVRSLSAWEPWVHKPSWAIQADFSTAREMERDPQHTIHFNLNAGSGLSFAIPHLQGSLVYAMADVETGVGGIFDDGYRAGIGGTSGLLIPFGRVSRTHFFGSFIRYGAGDVNSVNKLSLIQSFSMTKNTEVRLTAERLNHYQEGRLTLNLFY